MAHHSLFDDVASGWLLVLVKTATASRGESFQIYTNMGERGHIESNHYFSRIYY